MNSFDPAVIEHAISLPAVDAVMVDYNVLRPEREPLIARAAVGWEGRPGGYAFGDGTYAASAAAAEGGRRTSGTRPAPWPSTAASWRAARGFRFLHRLPDMTGSQAALAYVLANPGVSAAVFGATRPQHLRENLAASGLVLADGVAARIQGAQNVSS